MEKIKGFAVIEPQCKLDRLNDVYLPYAVIGEDLTEEEINYVEVVELPYELGDGDGVQQYR